MQYDVVVVGASSAGLYAAERLAKGGLRVAVLERQDQLDHARRTLIVTPQLRHVLGKVPAEALLHKIDTMAVATRSAAVDIPLHDPDLIIERNAFIQYLATRAQAAGAELCYGHRFSGLAPHGDGAELLFNGPNGGGRIVTGAIIGADGVHSSVALEAGIGRPPAVSILQAEIELPQDWDPGLTKVWFDAAESAYFYWLIPESDNHAVVGLIGAEGSQTRELLQRFLRRYGFEAVAYQGARVAMHHPRLRPWTKIGAAPVLLVGDAAGQVKVTTVGGSVTGIWGAQAAAHALLTGSSYQSCLRPLKRELDLHWFVRHMLEKLDNCGYDRLVHNLGAPGRNFLSINNRDQMAGTLWKLILRRPQLMAMGLELLFKRKRSQPTLVTPAPLPD